MNNDCVISILQRHRRIRLVLFGYIGYFSVTDADLLN